MRNLVTNGVNTAFRTLGDLINEVTFTNVSPSGYNLTSGEVTTTSSDEVTISGILEKRYLSSADHAKERVDFLFKTTDMVDPTVYDIVRFDSKSWVIVASSDNGYVVNVTMEG